MRIVLSFLFIVFYSIVFGQVSSTHSGGDLPVAGMPDSLSCYSDMNVTLPAAGGPYYITGVDVSYDMSSVTEWTSEQRSYLYSPTLGVGESNVAGFTCYDTTDPDCEDYSHVTISYDRPGLTSFNSGPHLAGTDINFQLRAWRTAWGPSGNACTTLEQKIDANTWTVTVYYSTTPPPPGPGGIGTGIQLWMNPSVGLSAASWTDQVNSVTYNSIGGPAIQPSSYNFNTSIRFDGSNYFENPNSISIGEVYSVSNLLDGTVAGGADELGSGTYGYIHRNLSGRMISGDGYYSGDGIVRYIYADDATMNTNGTAFIQQVAYMNDNVSNYQESNNLNVPSDIVDGSLNSQAEYFDRFDDAIYIGRGVSWATWLYAIGDISEVIVYDTPLSSIQRNRVSTYLAIKYGITLGLNGTSMDYNNSFGTTVWSQAANSGYAYDIGGIALDQNSELNQPKSRSMNQTAGTFNDILIIANSYNFSTPVPISTDQSAFIWGHNNGPTINTGNIVNITTDNGENMETIFSRHWKGQETGTIGTNTLQFDLTNVVGAGNVVGQNDLNNLRLLVDEDGDFTSGATSISPSAFSNVTNLAQFEHDFQPTSGNHMDQFNGFFFTLASIDVNATPLPVTLIHFSGENNGCDNSLSWETSSEENHSYFELTYSYNLIDWDTLGRVDGTGNSSSLKEYTVAHRNVVSNDVYYRLKQVDLNGDETFVGNVIHIESNCHYLDDFKLYPNPADLSFTFHSALNGELIIENAKGKVIKTANFQKGKTIVNTASLAQGVYFVKVKYNSDNIIVEKLMILHK